MILFSGEKEAYCILKTITLVDDLGFIKGTSTIQGVMRHPLYKNKPLIIDDKGIAQQYIACLQQYETSDISYKLVSSEESYPLWVYN